MGQVPSGSPPYLLVGDGRLSRHLQHYFTLERLPWRLWTRSQGRPVSDAVIGARAVLLLIPDDEIEAFLERHADPGGPVWVHCSGTLSTPLATGFHPLMTFGDELYGPEVYRAVVFVGERGGRRFGEVFPDLANPCFAIDPADRPLYHAVVAMAGNFTTLLWQHAFEVFEDRLELPRTALYPYLDRVAVNLVSSAEPLTGPLARGDSRTITRHLESLEGDPYQAVYASFVEAYERVRTREAR